MKYIIAFIRLMLKILPIGFWIALIFAFDKPYIAFLTLIAVATHELGHIAAFLSLSRKYVLFGATSGLRLRSRSALSYKEELRIAVSGPLANILLFFLASPFMVLGEGYAEIFGLINLFTAISNLLPLEGYDGYRILDCLINQHFSSGIPYAALRALSFLLSAALAILALYLIRSFDGGYWIFFIFLFALLRAISSDRAVFAKKSHAKR